MKRDPKVDVSSLLRELRRRYLIRFYLDALAITLLLAGGAVVVAATWMHFAGPSVSLPMWLPASFALLAILAAGVWTGVCAPSLHRIAQVVDRAGQTRDRLLTALALSERQDPSSPLEELAQRECEDFLASHNLRALISCGPPRFGAWLIVPLIAWATLAWQGHLERLAFNANKERAQQAIAGTKSAIEQLAREAEKAAQQARSDELRKLAEELQKSVRRLQNESNSEEAQKAAMRELSSLEEMMRELQRQPDPADEVKELAKALSSLPGMQDVLNALNEKDLAEAQRAMDQAMQKQNENKPDQLTEEEVEKRLQQAMQRLGDQHRLSEALQRFAEKAKQQAGGGLSQQAMRQLQQMMQQMSRQGQQGDSDNGQQQRQMALQEMIAALENMKFGEGSANQGSESQQVPNGPQISIESFGSANPQGQPQLGNAQQPSGRPGSEHDFGTTETPFGGKSDPQEKGGELALKGQLAQGEMLSMKLPSAGDNSKSARRYKELVESAASAAEDAVQQENIPLGSRFLVKRYFESIRPKE